MNNSSFPSPSAKAYRGYGTTDTPTTPPTPSPAETLFALSAVDDCTVRGGTCTFTSWSQDGTGLTDRGIYGDVAPWAWDIRVAPGATVVPRGRRLLVALTDIAFVGTRRVERAFPSAGSYDRMWE
jgi:hypothetical protein